MNKCKKECPEFNMVTPFGTLTKEECLTYTPKLNIDGDYIINSKNGIYALKPLVLNDNSGGNANTQPAPPDGVFNQITVNKGKVSYQTVPKHTYQQKDSLDCCGGNSDSSTSISGDANNQLSNATDGLLSFCKVTAGSNVSVTGVGTNANPYVISSMGGSGGTTTVINDLTNMLNFTQTATGINVTFKDNLTLDKLLESKEYQGDKNVEVVDDTIQLIDQQLTDSALSHNVYDKALTFDKTGVLTGVELLETSEVKTVSFKDLSNIDVSITYKKIGGLWHVTEIQ